MDKATIRSLIERKKAQIENFRADRNQPEKDRSFKPAVYDQKIKDLESDIADLEKQLEAPTAA